MKVARSVVGVGEGKSNSQCQTTVPIVEVIECVGLQICIRMSGFEVAVPSVRAVLFSLFGFCFVSAFKDYDFRSWPFAG